ncbi:unnamed protein product [Linum tenue]|uniref:Glycosyltransferase n=1 Tax=Linum tenue TaxID=586396 RepID=A0AAV0M004_9ROSI|nr:unnamed protein product [Linum tenue]
MTITAELIMIPIPAIGHLPPVFEFSKRLISQTNRLSVTIVLIRTPFAPEIESFSDSLAASCDPDRIKFIRVSGPNIPPLESIKSAHTFFPQFLDSQKDAVREALLADRAKQSGSSVSTVVVGVVADILTTAVVEEVGRELEAPTYLFFPSCGAVLSMLLSFPAEFQPTVAAGDPDGEIFFPGFVNHVPHRMLPATILDEEGYAALNEHVGRFREVKGILLNSYEELEAHAVESLVGNSLLPPVFCVGPVLDLKGQGKLGKTSSSIEKIMTWLDDQPESSVVFLCFGTMGRFGGDQVGEIARGLERSGHRFLWALRRPPSDYDDLTNILPEGFSDRTVGNGRVVGWVPQKAVLAHKAVGGFVSHCGWNSILESLWFGVQVAVWPMYAEQQLNAFQLVVELGLATEIKISNRMTGDDKDIVSATEVERGIKRLMEEGVEERRAKLKKISEIARKTLMDGGSSFTSTNHFVRNVLD